jgi:hypothetical protein
LLQQLRSTGIAALQQRLLATSCIRCHRPQELGNRFAEPGSNRQCAPPVSRAISWNTFVANGSSPSLKGTLLRNDARLLAEEYDPRARCQMGNFPQAFSHVALVNTA